MSKSMRRKKFIDAPVQGSFVLQYLKHWALILISTVVLALVWQTLTSGPIRGAGEFLNELWLDYAPFIVALVLLTPVIIYDSIKLSHRFVGPMYRVRNEMKRLVRGEKVSPIHFRDGDFWQDFADDFNMLIDRQKEAGQENSEDHQCENSLDTALSSTVK